MSKVKPDINDTNDDKREQTNFEENFEETVVTPFQTIAPNESNSEKSEVTIRDLSKKNIADDAISTVTSLSDLSLDSRGNRRYNDGGEYTSFFCLSPNNRLRRILLRITRSNFFNGFIIATIFVNCFFLAIDTPNTSPDIRLALYIAEWIFIAIFTIEMIIKMLASGLILHKGAYLRNPWNVLDFIIVIVGYLQIIPGFGNFSAIRALRALRPLKTINGLKGLLGVQLWNGILHNRCVYVDTNEIVWENGRQVICATDSLFGSLARRCKDGQVCMANVGENPNYGFTNFDNILWAFLQVFQIITLEGWSEIMYTMMDSWNVFAVIYFVIVVSFGGMFIVNLALAVMNEKYQEVTSENDEMKDDELSWRVIKNFLRHELKKTGKCGKWIIKKLKWKKEVKSTVPIVKDYTMEQMNAPWYKKIWYGFLKFDLWLSRLVRKFVESLVLRALVIFVIVLNTIVLATEFDGIEKYPWIIQHQRIANYVFTAFFTIELILKLYGLRRDFVKDKFNLLDLFVVATSLLEIILSRSSGFVVLRALRLIRILKLLSWESLRKLTGTIIDCIPSIGYLSIIFAMFIFVAALVGMQLFGTKFNFPNEEKPIANFDDFITATITVFQLITTENFNELMWNGMRGTSVFACIYYILVIFIGNYIILNLFLAILIQSFEENHTEKLQLKKREELFQKVGEGRPSKFETFKDRVKSFLQETRRKIDGDPIKKPENPEKFGGVELTGRSLYLFSPQNKFRRVLASIVLSPTFDYIMLGFIILNSVLLAVDTPGMDPKSEFAKALRGFDIFFTVIFFIEMVLKIIVLGLVFCRTAYLRDMWNVLDFIIVLSSIVALIIGDSRLSALRAIRTLRTLRPLRLINRASGIRQVVNCLLLSIPAIFDIIIIAGLVNIIFGILGVQLFRGSFYHCSAEHLTKSTCVSPLIWNDQTQECSIPKYILDTIIRMEDCKEPLKWVNARTNFDNIFEAVLTLFEVSTIEGWPKVLEWIVNSVGKGFQPKRANNMFAGYYLIVFIVISSMLILNLFVSVVIWNFNRIKDEEGGSALLTQSQKDWVNAQQIFMTLKLKRCIPPPKNFIRRIIFRIVEHTAFDIFIGVCIFVNVLIMSTEFYGMPSWMVLMILKLIAYGVIEYFRSGWNCFDAFVVVVSEIGIFTSSIPNFGLPINPTLLRIFRVFRIVRILRLIKIAKGVRILLETLYFSIPSLINVGAFLLLLFFVYAILGMNLFAHVKHGKHLNEYANFKNFLVSMLTLLRMSTGEDWNGIMRDCMNTTDCTGDECGSVWAFLYFVSFIILASFVMMNLFIAVILDNFSSQMRMENSPLNSDIIHKFVSEWQKLDPKATQVIDTPKLKNLLIAIGKPLGLEKDCSRAELIRKMVSLDIRERQGKIHFVETLIPLAKRVWLERGADIDLPFDEEKRLEKKLLKAFSNLTTLKESKYTTGEYFAATYIQAAYRGAKVRKDPSNELKYAGLTLVKTEDGRIAFKFDKKLRKKKIDEAGNKSPNAQKQDSKEAEKGNSESNTQSDITEKYRILQESSTKEQDFEDPAEKDPQNEGKKTFLDLFSDSKH